MLFTYKNLSFKPNRNPLVSIIAYTFVIFLAMIQNIQITKQPLIAVKIVNITYNHCM